MSGGARKYSRLYPLVPQGLGTGLVQSQTSLICSTAAAHSVYVGKLLSAEFLPGIGKYQQDRIGGPVNAGLYKAAHALNGFGTLAIDFLEELQRLTGQNNLWITTMIPSGAFLNDHGLFRRERSWCPHCLAEWAEGRQPLYEALVWTLQNYEVCFRHRAKMQNSCPRCGKTSSMLSAKMRNGYCPSCKQHLGQISLYNNSDSDYRASEKELWVASNLEELILMAPDSDACLDRPLDVANMILAQDKALDPQAKEVIQRMALGKLPTLAMVLEFCRHFGISLSDFFCQPLERLVVNAVESGPVGLSKRVSNRRKVDREAVSEKIMQQISGSAFPESVTVLAKILGVSSLYLYQEFPEIVARISDRRKAQSKVIQAAKEQKIKEIVFNAVWRLRSSGLVPTARDIVKLTGKPFLFQQVKAVEAYKEAMCG